MLDSTGDPDNIAYLPSAFDDAALADARASATPTRSSSARRTPRCSASTRFTDGYNVVIASRATGFERQLRERGYNPIGVDLSELLLGGGGVKCCTLELRR